MRRASAAVARASADMRAVRAAGVSVCGEVTANFDSLLLVLVVLLGGGLTVVEFEVVELVGEGSSTARERSKFSAQTARFVRVSTSNFSFSTSSRAASKRDARVALDEVVVLVVVAVVVIGAA